MSYTPCAFKPPKGAVKNCNNCEYCAYFAKGFERDRKERCMLWKSGEGRLIQNKWTTPSWCPKKG